MTSGDAPAVAFDTASYTDLQDGGAESYAYNSPVGTEPDGNGTCSGIGSATWRRTEAGRTLTTGRASSGCRRARVHGGGNNPTAAKSFWPDSLPSTGGTDDAGEHVVHITALARKLFNEI